MSYGAAVSLPAILGKLLSLEAVYALTGVVLFIFAWMTWADRGNPRRKTSAAFWLILGVTFAFAGALPHWVTGLLILAMVALDGAGRVARGTYDEATKAEQAESARRLGDRIFLPVLVIPAVTFAFAFAVSKSEFLMSLGLDVTKAALIGLGFGGVAAMGVGLWLTGGTARMMMQEGRRLNDAVGTVIILPQLLASLGVIFTAAKVGDLIAKGIYQIIPADNLFLLVLANCLGMALFTIVMGNSFAAFPVIAAGVLVPLIIQPFGVNPAMAGIITLTAGSSGTLMTPMAANFNIVPTALLNMRDQYGVIKFQLPFALTIWSLHVLLMWLMIKLM
ncbi:MAG TPA: DUF979 domain-containing protein [Blastocatellia bacterium]|nr:DUF979 domain-containing protein [Blastocatellia bacterium]